MENDFDIKNFITELRQTQILMKINEAQNKKEREMQKEKRKLKKKKKKMMKAMSNALGASKFNFPKAINKLSNLNLNNDKNDDSNPKPVITPEFNPSLIKKSLFATSQTDQQ